MAYSEKLIDHFEHPRNVGTLDKNAQDVGTGMVGAPACGDVMRLQIKVNPEGVIEDAKFKTYGCGSAIASSSLVSEWVKGKTLEEYENETHMVVEGALACKTIEPLARSYGVELPITKAVRSVLWDKASIEETIMTLFDRPLTTEFWGLEHEGAIYAK